MVKNSYTLQNSNLFSTTQLFYAKSGYIVHVYFSGKTATALASMTKLVATNLPRATMQQDCRAIAVYDRGQVEIITTDSTSSMTVISSIAANMWLRFSYTYVSAS